MRKINLLWTRLRFSRLITRRDGFGMNELLGIAVALIIAGFVVIPGLRVFAGHVMTGLSDWWDDTIAAKLFPTT